MEVVCIPVLFFLGWAGPAQGFYDMAFSLKEDTRKRKERKNPIPQIHAPIPNYRSQRA